MSHVPHELAEEFADKADILHDLKMNNAHFVKIAEEYHTVNRAIHRIETGVEPASPVHETELRKQRMVLKDEIAGMVAKAAA